MPQTFRSYLDDVNSSTECCRSCSLLIPITSGKTNEILPTLCEWGWICESVLISRWQGQAQNEHEHHDWYYQCLPTEEELEFLYDKHSLPPDDASQSLQEDQVKRHFDSKSLLVPLTDDATAFILRVLFEVPILLETHASSEHINLPSGIKNCEEREITVQKWISYSGMMVIHNCDGRKTASLSMELESFPENMPSATFTNKKDECSNSFTFADVFAGIGGFRIGLEACGGTCVGSCEIDRFARDTYRRNFIDHDNNEFFVNDITRLEIPPDTVDVLCGGFPCQSFSTLASKYGKDGGLDTPNKGKLFFHLLRVLRKSRPKLFIFENVKGLMKLDDGSHFEKIVCLLKESGYDVSYGVVDSAWFLPQRRERVYFVGVRLDIMSESTSDAGSVQNFHNFASELKEKYQIYNNDIPNADTEDRYDRVLQYRIPPSGSQCLTESCLGDILESSESISQQHWHCFLNPSQWQKLRREQRYIQLHSDGTGQLLTEMEKCSQTLTSSYRQRYDLHSQFIVPVDSVYLAEQQASLVEVSLRKKHDQKGQENAVASPHKSKKFESHSDKTTMPRFFTPREW